MNCPSCNRTVPDSARFCPECGTNLTKPASCSQCNAELPPDSKFCMQCGAKVGAGGTAAQPNKSSQPAADSLTTGFVFRDAEDLPEMVVIPAGEFMMGSDRQTYEKPIHRVSITRPFALGRYPVTFDEFERFVNNSGYNYVFDDMGWGRERRPVVNISWNDAKAYCRWISERTNMCYRLPSEAQWEYAARAGTTTNCYWGDDPWQNQANFVGSGSAWSGEKSAPVGSFPPNRWGLYDMLGNVWEWCEDQWNINYQDAPINGSAWYGGSDRRVLRGCCAFDHEDRISVSSRRDDVADYALRSIGFRLAKSF